MILSSSLNEGRIAISYAPMSNISLLDVIDIENAGSRSNTILFQL